MRAGANRRYGLELAKIDLLALASAIHDGRRRFTERQPLAREIHVILQNEVRAALLYDPRSDVILSTLPSYRASVKWRGLELHDSASPLSTSCG